MRGMLSLCFNDCELRIFENIQHDEYFTSDCVIEYINQLIFDTH